MTKQLLNKLRLTAKEQTVERKELSVDPDMQMRMQIEQATVDEYADNIEAILEEKPIDVVEVEGNIETRWFIVDGFHRYHAAGQANLDAVRVRLMRGTYEDAVQYAMSANWENGLRPKAADAQRSISILLDTAPDFGFDSKAVNKWVTSFGIPASTARNYTKKLVEDVKAKRDAEIIRLDAEGKTQREIAGSVGCDQKTVSNTLKEQSEEKCPQDKNPQASVSDVSDITAESTSTEAFNKALGAHETERTLQESNVVQLESVKVDSKDRPWAWAAAAADTLEEAFSGLSASEMAAKLRDDPHAFKEFNRVFSYMQQVTSLGAVDSETEFEACSESVSDTAIRPECIDEYDTWKAQLRAYLENSGVCQDFNQAEVRQMLLELAADIGQQAA